MFSVSYSIRVRQALYLLLLLLKFKAQRLPVFVVAILLLPSNFWLFEVLSGVMSSNEETVARKLMNAGTFPWKALVGSSGNFSRPISNLQALVAAGKPRNNWLIQCGSPQSCSLQFYKQLRPATTGEMFARISFESKSTALVECTVLQEEELACPFLHHLALQSLSPSGRVFRDVQFISLTDTVDHSKTETHRASRRSICSRVESTGNVFVALMHTVLYHILIATAGCMVHFTATTIAFIAGLKESGYLQLMISNGLSVGAYWTVIIVSIAIECAVFSAIIGPCYALQCPNFYPKGSAIKLSMMFYAYCFSLVSLSLLATVLLRSFFLIVVATVAIIISVVTVTVLGVIRIMAMKSDDYLLNVLLVFPPGHMTQYALYTLLPKTSRDWHEAQISYLQKIPNGMLIFPIVVTLLTIYADFVLSSGNGMGLPLTFPFSRSFWLPDEAKMVSSIPVSCADSDCSKSYIEPLHSGLPAIYINDISVCYDRGCCALENQETVVQALDSISCTIYQDQITALIGHNGAGKTTLIRTLTGEQTPTSGVAVIGDRLVTDPYQRMALRRVVSTCGQTNVLCQQLTVMESITLATLSKGFMLESQIDNIKTMMEQLGLADKADVQAFDLSGGQLRKLCCIIALIGDPKIVMLDEPTSGLDPVSRRCLWRIMQERRQGRCIMLCTQFMDEADVLADRKLFLSGGRLVCAGSSLFLKHLFGCCPTIGISLRSSQDAAKLLESIPPGVHLLNRSGTELQLSVSSSGSIVSSELHLLAETVKILEELQRQNGSPVEAFGVSQANLDEIFMRLENFNTMDVVSAIKNRRLASIVSLKSPDDELKLVTSRVDHSLLELRLDYYKANKLQRSFSKTFGSLLVMNLRRQVRSPVQALCRLVMPLVLLAIVFSVAFVEKKRYELSQSIAKHLTREGHKMSPVDLLENTMKQSQSELIRVPVLPTALSENLVCLFDSSDEEEMATNACLTAFPRAFKTKLMLKPKSVSVDKFVLPTDSLLNPELRQNCENVCFILYASSWNTSHPNANRSLVIGQFWHKSRSEIIFKPMADYFSMMWRYFVSTDDDSDPWKTVRLTAVVPFSQYYTIQMEIFVLVLLFSVVPVTYMSDPVEDRSSGVRQQMRVMGLDSKIYWLNTFAIHWIQYAVFIVLSAAMCLVWNRYQSLFLLYNVWIPMLLLGSVSNLLSVYCIGALQRTPSYSVLAIYLFFILFILAVLTFVMTNRIAGAVCVWLVPPLAPMMLPFTAMKMAGYGLLFFELSHLGDIPELQKVFLNYPDTIHSLVAMAFHIVLLFGLLILLDNWPTVYSLGQQCCNKDKAADSHQLKQSQKDDDELGVQTEAQRVLKNPRSDQNLLEVRDVEKVYPNGVRAVRGVTFGAMTGEVFGLLGQNGAGKTTLMSAIVGQLAATRGKVEVRQFDGDWMVSQLGTQLGIIGFCPQHDPIFRRITVEEHLTFYSRVRGIPELLVPEQTDRLIRGLGLAEHRFKAAKELSGGNKRRLCLAIALLGCPSIVVIDEASTGVDPENKRAIWKAIRSLAEGGKRTVVVTTHSMEEVEALCGRVGIMDRGGMIGFGTVQQLRSRYGKAYTLEALLPFSADLHETSSRKSVLKAAIQQQFPQAAVLDDVGASVQFQIPTESVASLSDSIRWLADNKTELNVQYFSLHQMSLDQIFVNMIRQHAEAVLSEKDSATGKSDQGGC
ncbi:hypothetical protein BOX15_Mlig033575g1 [Macrostomum lignano]|nr:hypothetical protein BOX15_Mlig033575g1 [Macrostomum lignano]